MIVRNSYAKETFFQIYHSKDLQSHPNVKLRQIKRLLRNVYSQIQANI